MRIRVDVSYKKISTPIRLLFVFNSKLFIATHPKLWIIDCSGKQYPEVDLLGLDIIEVAYRNKMIFATIASGEALFCKLGHQTFTRMPTRPDLIRFGSYILFSRGRDLFVIRNPEQGAFDKVCSFEGCITDFACTSRRIVILVGHKVYWSSWNPRKGKMGTAFQEVAYLASFVCRKLHVNCLSVFFAESSEYLVCMMKYKPVLIEKPKFYYNLSLTKYHVVFLSDRVLIFSIFSGRVEKTVSLTGFSSVYDVREDKLWIYANSLFKVSINVPRGKVSRYLVEQKMFRRAISADNTRKDVVEEYARHLFRKKRFRKALEYLSLLGKQFYFDKAKLIRNSIGEKAFMVDFYSDLSRGLNLPGRLFLNFLIKKAFNSGEHLELVSKILLARKNYRSFIRLIRKHKDKKIRLFFVERTENGLCSEEEKKAIHKYNLYFNTRSLVLQSIAAKKFKKAKNDIVEAYKEKVLNRDVVEGAEVLLSHIRSKPLTYIFTRLLGKRCLLFMYNHQAYANLPYYIRFSAEVLEDLQLMLKIMGSLSEEIEKLSLYALKKRIHSTGIFEAFLETARFIFKLE